MVPPVASFDLQHELHQRIYRFVMRVRFAIAPLPVLVGGYVMIADPTVWRRVVMISAVTLAVSLSLLYDWRVKRGHKASLESIILFVALVLHPALLVATGGILSPVLIGLLVICFVASTLLRPSISQIILVCQLVCIWGAALLEYSQLLGSLIPIPFRSAVSAPASPTFLWVFSVVVGIIFSVTRELGCRIQEVFADLLDRALSSREESLRLHREQLAELTLLSGEIAHELKNPLASVKGLAALLAKRSEGAEPEPLGVLRREVDRMQGILDEFLNFSRPLVPLNLADTDLVMLCHEVARMHEGILEQRSLGVDVLAEAPVLIACDPRKVRQILINLLQNAIEASRAPSTITIRIRKSETDILVSIDDEGDGVAPDLGNRVFEAGVTNKPGGSGLGLSVARGLARQHGGEVTLQPHVERGCSATLKLPRVSRGGSHDGVVATAQTHSNPNVRPEALGTTASAQTAYAVPPIGDPRT